MERLQKVIARAGICSRRAAEKLILDGYVTVDGTVVTDLGTKVDVSTQTVAVNGEVLRGEEKKVYYLLNKPKGYITTAKDDFGRKTALDLLPESAERVYPVGRLDADSEGLLLLTNDGDLMNGLLHPKGEVEKIYLATVAGDLDENKLARLRSGIELSDGMTAPAGVEILGDAGKFFKVQVTLHEGKNRQVRRMMEAVGCRVVSLKRIAFANLGIGNLKAGETRTLTEKEIAALYKLAGLEQARS